jgi:hypothetical protein
MTKALGLVSSASALVNAERSASTSSRRIAAWDLTTTPISKLQHVREIEDEATHMQSTPRMDLACSCHSPNRQLTPPIPLQSRT